MEEKNDTNLASILSMDFKRNKEANFSKTICLMKNLINEIDDRAKRLKGKKKTANGIWLVHIWNAYYSNTEFISLQYYSTLLPLIIYLTFQWAIIYQES